MALSTAKNAFWRGFRIGLPFILAAGPFGLLFGVIATEAGFDVIQVLSMGFLVIAGAAQFTAVAQMQDASPIIVILAASLAVNLRMAMYSASLAPHLQDAPLWQRAFAAYVLVDNVYALSISEFTDNPKADTSQKMAFYFGTAVASVPVWYLSTFLGAWFGQSIPPEYALDFAPAFVFIGVVAPMFRTRAHVAAGVTSVVVALALDFLPFSSGLLIAGFAAMVVGAEFERRTQGSMP